MGTLAEILFAIFQTLPIWGKSEQANSSKFASIALFAVVLVVVFLIWKYNPVSPQLNNEPFFSQVV